MEMFWDCWKHGPWWATGVGVLEPPAAVMNEGRCRSQVQDGLDVLECSWASSYWMSCRVASSFDLLFNRIPSVCPWDSPFQVEDSSWEGYGFCCQPLLDNQLSTVGRQPLYFVAAELAVLQGLNGFLLTSDVELIPVTKMESLWIHMQQQYF